MKQGIEKENKMKQQLTTWMAFGLGLSLMGQQAAATRTTGGLRSTWWLLFLLSLFIVHLLLLSRRHPLGR